MTALIISFIACAVFILAFEILLCVWVYQDAKIRSDKPLAWLLVTIFVPNMFGILIYLLVGRTIPGQSPKKLKYPIIVTGIASIVTFAIAAVCVFAAISGDILPMEGVSIGMIENNIGSKWDISFKSSGDEFDRTLTLTHDEMENITVEGSCQEGALYLLILQNDIVRLIDLTNYPKSNLDMSEFQAGRIKFTLYNNQAREAKMKMDW